MLCYSLTETAAEPGKRSTLRGTSGKPWCTRAARVHPEHRLGVERCSQTATLNKPQSGTKTQHRTGGGIMRFGLLYEMEMPRPWNERSEYNIYWQALEQIELADRLGFNFVWEVEHHFLEEYSHSSAPEVFFGAVSQRTKNIRIAHGVRLLPLNFNNPIKVA